MPGMMPPAAAGPQAASPPEQQPQGEPASPEEQQLYNEFVVRAKKLIFDPKTEEVRPAVVKMLEEGDDPKLALGQAAAMIGFRVMQEAQKAGVQIPEEILIEGGQEVFSDLAQIASTVGPVDFMADDAAFEAAFLLATDELRQLLTSAGMLDPEQEMAAFQEMAAADKDGRLGAMMEGLQ